MISSIEIKKVNLVLNRIAFDTVSFDCGDAIKGTITTLPDNGCITVLEGGYQMANQHCPACAVEAITELYLQLEHGNDAAGLNYQTYRKTFQAGVNSILRH